MAEQKGRDFLLKVGNNDGPPETFTTLGGLRSRSFSINNETVDITNSDSAGMRELLDGAGVQSMSVSGSGVFKDDAAFNTMQGYVRNNQIQTFQIVVPGLGTYEGEFLPASLDQDGEHNGEVSYSVSLESSGAIGFTVI